MTKNGKKTGVTKKRPEQLARDLLIKLGKFAGWERNIRQGSSIRVKALTKHI